jgi:hypothetical protein
VFARITSEWRSWPTVIGEVQAATGMPVERIAAALRALEETRAIDLRRRGGTSRDVRQRLDEQ